MKYARLVIRICSAVAITAGLFSIGHAQNREKFGISAKAGGVNAVAGRVMVKREGQALQLLSNQDELKAGDVVTTGADSQAEILLNPGSYLRVGEQSEVMLIDNSLDKLLVRLKRGSAIIEATGGDNTELRIGLITNKARLLIVRRGIYRINAQPDATELLVRKGRVLIGDLPGQIVKSGKKLTFTGGEPLAAKLSKADQDEFDNWSRERGKTLARANERLTARLFNSYVGENSFWNWAANSWGIWAFSPFSRCYTFLPFRFGWASPYGHYYGQYYDPFGGLSGCCGYQPGYRPVIVSNPTSSRGTSGGSSGLPGGSGGVPRNPPTARPVLPPHSQAGPRDPDGGSRRTGRIDIP